MKCTWIYSLLFIPFLGYAITFNDLSTRAYTVSEEIIHSDGRMKSADFEKASMIASEPLHIETSGRKITADNREDSGMEYGVMIDYSLKTPSVRSAQEYEFELIKKGTQHEMNAQKGRIQIALKRDWLLYQLEEERTTLLVQKRDFSHKTYLSGEKKFKAGRLSQMELLRLENEYRSALEEIAAARMEAEHAQHRLKETAMMEKAVIIDDMPFRFIRAEALSDHLQKAPLIQSLNIRIETLDAQITTLRHSNVEFIALGLGMTQEPTQNSIDFRLTVPLALSGKNENKIAALMSERSALVHMREITKQKLYMSVHGLLEHLEEREKRIKVLNESEKHYEALFNMAQKGYEGGVIGQFEYLASKNAYYEACLRTLALKQNYIEEMTTIEEKIGGIW